MGAILKRENSFENAGWTLKKCVGFVGPFGVYANPTCVSLWIQPGMKLLKSIHGGREFSFVRKREEASQKVFKILWIEFRNGSFT